MTMTPIREMQAWTAAMRAEGKSENTIRRRVGTLARIERDTGTRTRDLDVEAINRWLQRYRAGGTRAAYFQDLEAYFAYRNLIDEDGFTAPTQRMKRPRQPKRRPRPITTAQLHAALDTATGDVLDWILLGAYQGCRVGDAAAVAGENIDGDTIHMPHSKGGRDWTIPLHPEVAAIASRRPRRGWWFPGWGRSGHITEHTVAERVCAHFDALGVPHFTYHRLRHWCCTEMLRAGASIRETQEFMRHESITSTALYTEVLMDEMAAAAARLPRRPAPAQPRRLTIIQ